jgi:hypothetical protein
MSDMTIAEFCERHNACRPGREWAVENCADMAGVWATARPQWLMWIATRPGVLTARELRLCAVQAARRVEHLMTDRRSKDAIAIAERHANGLATDEELAAARADAAEAFIAATAAAYTTAAAACAYTTAAAYAAADAAAADAAAAAAAASWEATAAWLRETTSPNFKKEEDR